MILAYLDIGKIISEKTKTGRGTAVIKQLSKDLRAENLPNEEQLKRIFGNE